MVWIDAQGNIGPYAYAKYTAMTAPYTTDPALAQSKARPLRTENCVVGSPDENYAVGCGYRAHMAVDGLRIIRLSDGAGWLIPGLTEPDKWTFNWSKVLGVTCKEIFFQITSALGVNIGRIPFSSLGDPEPSNL
jgi:hypothetical protein